jgi:isoleucyl-tRNA synthetase
VVLGEAAAGLLYEGAEVLERCTGADLVGRRYQRPFDLLSYDRSRADLDAWRVVGADFVATDDGSGIVHLAPAFGEDDAAWAGPRACPPSTPSTPTARFDHRVAPWRAGS